jgi:hypothetical protein
MLLAHALTLLVDADIELASETWKISTLGSRVSPQQPNLIQSLRNRKRESDGTQLGGPNFWLTNALLPALREKDLLVAMQAACFQ